MRSVVPRTAHVRAVRSLLSWVPVVAVLGARQVGKTTLAREVLRASPGPHHHFDLEEREDLRRLSDPSLALRNLRGTVVLDEVHRLPEVFRALRVLADRRPRRARFLVLGSASPDLLRQTSESLAGRISYYELPGFRMDEVGPGAMDALWFRGGFPNSYLAESDQRSHAWRRDFVRTFLERDLPQFGVTVPAAVLERCWVMLAHYHAQTWNGAEIAASLGVASSTVQRYLDLLVHTLVVRRLPPWHENLAKRQVRSPKVLIADPGILHALLDIRTPRDLAAHPKQGASWEGFLIGEVVRRLRADPEECYFWATHAGAELDLLVVRGMRRYGFEIKRTSAPRLTPSMRIAREDLHLDRLDVLHAGRHTFPMADGIRAVAASRLLEDLKPLR